MSASAAAMPSGTCNIRPATLSDAPALSKLKIKTFRETFVAPPEQGGFGIPYPPKELAAFELECYDVPVIEAELKGGKDGKTRTWVVEAAASEGDGSSLVGYLKVGTVKLPHPEVSSTVEEGEVGQLYLLGPYQGGGLGRQLMDLAMSHIEATYGPDKRVWVGVWSGNHRAQRFYGRYGFSKVGEYLFPVGAHNDHEFIFRKDPAPKPAAASATAAVESSSASSPR